jgi:hypothetical protein
MKRLAILGVIIVLFMGLLLAPALPAQDGGHEEDVVEHENDHDGNDTHEEQEYHDPWMNLYVTGGVIVAFMVAVVVWPRK